MPISKTDLADRLNVNLIATGIVAVAAGVYSAEAAFLAIAAIAMIASLEIVSIHSVRINTSAVPYTAIAVLALLVSAIAGYLLRDKTQGIAFLFFPVCVAILADCGAYFGGKLFPSRPISKDKLGPGKTWSGLLFGIWAGSTAGWLYLMGTQLSIDLGFTMDWNLALSSVFVASMAMLGDMYGSMLKRLLRTKDSSKIFGKHGGAFDRFISQALAIVAVGALLEFTI